MNWRWIGIAAVVSAAASYSAFADETDQFLTWDVELADSADAINEYLNGELRGFIAYRDNAIEPPCDCDSLGLGFFDYIFKGRMTARFKEFIRTSEAVEVYPARTVSNVEYNRMSIYEGLSFPFILPMAPTLRVGEVYLGDDKFGHLLGFGKRYYRKYLRYLDEGLSEDEAIVRVIRWGVMSENTVVGAGIDGIFSHADLEANYQGMLLARHMCHGDSPYIGRGDDGRWFLARTIDIRDYVNPYFDESYNVPHFWGRRRELVLAIIREQYAHRTDHPLVIERFMGYASSAPSPSVQLVRDYFLERGVSPQRDQVFSALDLPPNYPITLLAGFPVP